MRSEGKSYLEIKSRLKIPKSTLSDWFTQQAWSQEIRKKLTSARQAEHTLRIRALDKERGENLKKVYAEAEEEARQELETLKYDPLFISGIMLYWGEGEKAPRHAVKLSNTDPKLIQLYVRFLTHSCRIPIEKIKAHILIYPELEERTCRAYWSKIARIPWENFTKSVLIRGRNPTRRLNWGVCIITVSSTYFKHKMLEWIRLLPEELLGKGYYENISGS